MSENATINGMSIEENVARNVASNIVNNRHLRKFLMALKAENRRHVYDSVSPFLKFKAKPFWLINS